MKGNQKIYTIQGLDCANCAAKLENEIRKIKEVDEASVNFMGQKLILGVKEGQNLETTMENVMAVIQKKEPNVKVTLVQSAGSVIAEVEHGNYGDACACACGHDHRDHDDNHEERVHQHHDHGNACGCGHDHSHSHQDHPDHDHDHSDHDNDHDHSDHDHGALVGKSAIMKLVLGAVLFAIAVLAPVTGLVQLGIFLVSYLIIGGDILLRAIKNILKGQVFDENFLMAIATVGAFAIGEYPEGVAVMLFYQVGELFQSYAVNRSRKSIAGLMDIRPDYANVQKGNEIVKVSPQEVMIGDIIVVKAGERFPLDGIVLTGDSAVDTSALTGESMPREVETGDGVISGCVNLSGLLTVKVTKGYGESTVAKILDLVENASNKKANTENFITKFARVYTPAVVGVAALLAIIPPLVLEGATFAEWFYRGLVFLVISCPCALVISIPLSFFGGIGGASKQGILIKGSNYLEALAYAEIVAFDKTGTLTKGMFEVSEISPAQMKEEELLEICAYGESFSNHPIAKSILTAYGKVINQQLIESYEEIPGHGSKVMAMGKRILVGNAKLMRKENITFELSSAVGTIIYVAVDQVFAGTITIADQIKEDAHAGIRALKKEGIKRAVMLTGDAKSVGDKVGAALELDEVYTELLPADKVAVMEDLLKSKSEKGKLIFVGDGINDAPVLARADIGIAMGGLGSDAAIEAADIVIMTDEPSKIATAIKISHKTRAIVKQNIIFALGVKGVILILGAVGIASMWAAVFADVGVAFIAILNAVRALNTKNL